MLSTRSPAEQPIGTATPAGREECGATVPMTRITVVYSQPLLRNQR